jgi:hypothetical protein
MSDHDLGKAEPEFIGSIVSPFFWVLRNGEGQEYAKNGTLFFMHTGRRLIAVTAAHVVQECLDDSRSPMFVQAMIGANGGTCLPVDLGDRIIDRDRAMDIATLAVTAEEIDRLPRCEVVHHPRSVTT